MSGFDFHLVFLHREDGGRNKSRYAGCVIKLRPSRESFAASSAEYEAQMTRFGVAAKDKAGSAMDASNDLPDRGGTVIKSRRMRPASTSPRACAIAVNATVAMNG